ncbi:MAG: D-2-hydroxyacid dehydrogenase [Oscillospiraceae bacterium]|jgi:phosphoglycerate dehydrogenase-like enzyme|nr:D-2-hydroxyacid dehydrogenase [Oscillospiraceae bacterium]
MPRYIVLRNVPFTKDQVEALVKVINDGGFEALVSVGDEMEDSFPWEDCEAFLGVVRKEYIKKLSTAKWLQLAWAGAESLVGADYPNNDTILTNASGAYGKAIAEYMLCGALMLRHNLHTYARVQGGKEWNRIGVTRGMYGSRVVVVGLGDIGGTFAKYAKAMGAYVVGVRRSKGIAPEYVDELSPYEDLEGALKNADVVAVCLPATKETVKLFGERHVNAMKPEAVFVNAGRGVTVDESALTAALMHRRIAGAVLDVTEVEPLPKDSPLWDMDNVVITPHVSGRMDDPPNSKLIYEIFMDNLTRFCEGRPLKHVVDRDRGY